MIFVRDDWSFNSRLRKKFSQCLSNALSELAQAKNIFELAELNGCDKFSDVFNSLKMFEMLQDNVTYSLFLFNCFNTFLAEYLDIQSISGIKDIEEFLGFEDFIDNPNDYYDKKDIKEFIALYKDCFGTECDNEFINKMISDVKNNIRK